MPPYVWIQMSSLKIAWHVVLASRIIGARGVVSITLRVLLASVLHIQYCTAALSTSSLPNIST
jgi:hypothetical protein